MITSSNPVSKSRAITAIVTAYQRIDQTLATLQMIKGCEPGSDEILVHVDANQTQCEVAIRHAFPDVKVISSEKRIGPGGGRNKLIAAASNELIASFDDDSYPIDVDYFARVMSLLEKFPNASILCATVYHRGEQIETDRLEAGWVSDFSGGACIYRRPAFQSAGGYVPLPIAYGMEEVDLALRLHAQGGRILSTLWLRVFHDTDLKHHSLPEITAGSIANLALLTYLRYPPSLWIIGVGQCIKRIYWLIKNGRWEGILKGITKIPFYLWSHRIYRQQIESKLVRSYLALRRNPIAQEI